MSQLSIKGYMQLLLLGIIIAVSGIMPIPRNANADMVNAAWAVASGDLGAASRYYAAAADYYPWRYDLNIKAGRYAFEAGEAHSAIQYFERPGTISHLAYEDKLLLGDAYLEAGDALIAEAIWKSLLDLEDSLPVHERLLSLYQQRNDYASVIEQLKSLLALNPSEIDRYYQIGLLYAAIEPIQALPYLDQAVEIDANNASNARNLYNKIRTANLFDNQAYIYLIAGRQLANIDEWKLASVAIENAIKLEPNYADAWAYMGEARTHLAASGGEAISTAGLVELYKALQLDPDSILANTFMGLFWERQEKYSQARPYLEHAIVVDPNNSFLYSELGNILSKAGDLPAAQAEYEAAIQVNPLDPLFYRLLAQFALDNHIQIRQIALPAARQALNLNPGDVISLDLMAQVMLALQDYRSAERFLLDALRIDPGYAPACLHLGETYVFLGDSTSAHHWLALAQSIEPESWIASQAKRMVEYYFP